MHCRTSGADAGSRYDLARRSLSSGRPSRTRWRGMTMRGRSAMMRHGLSRSSRRGHRRRRRARHRRRRGFGRSRRRLPRAVLRRSGGAALSAARAPASRAHVTGNLADEAAVAGLYEGIAPLWASIHIAGGFAAAPLRETSAATLRQQIDMNFVSCALCCRAAVNAMRGAGAAASSMSPPAPRWNGAAAPAWSPIRRARRPSPRSPSRSPRRSPRTQHPGQRGRALDHGHAGQSRAMPKADFSLWPKVEEVAATIVFSPRPTTASPAARSCRCTEVDPLIPRPQSRRCQLHEMAVGIAEINAHPPARPFGAAFDANASIG